jgi:hypothetical protein
MDRLTLDGLRWLSDVFEPRLRASVILGHGETPDSTAADDLGVRWMVDSLMEHREKRLKEKEKDAVV